MAADNSAASFQRIPLWDLDPAKREQYEFEVKMFFMRTEKTKRYTCAPALVAQLGARAQKHAQN